MLPQAQAFRHPALPTTLEELDNIKANLKVEPWKSAYAGMNNYSAAQLSAVPNGPTATITNKGNFNYDMQIVYQCAMQWRLTGDTAYADKAMNLLNDYSATVTGWALSYLDYGDTIFAFTGADILRSYPKWTPTMTTNAQNMFSMIWNSIDMNLGQLRSANQGSNQLETAFAIAIYCDDKARFAECLDFYHHQPCCGLNVMQANGQVGDTGRDQGHAWGELQHYSWICEAAWKQGIDLYSEKNNAVLQDFEYYSQYNLGGSPAFIQAGPCYDLYFGGDNGRSMTATASAHLLVYNHYVTRKHLSAPFTTQWLAASANTGGSSIPWKFPGNAQPPGPPAPPSAASATPPPATSLTSADLGAVGVKGTAAYSSGTWTVTGAGTGMLNKPDSGQFAYKQMNGDGTIIAKVNSVTTPNAYSLAGIMIRDSLSTSANGFGIWMQPAEPTVPSNAISAVQRAATNSSTSQNDQTGFAPVLPPYWLKIVRRGTAFLAFSAPDGVTWSPLNNGATGRPPITMGNTVDVGLVVVSCTNSTPATATFTNVEIDPGAPTPPGAPTGLTATEGNNQVGLTWTASSGATSYNIKRGVSGGSYTTIGNASATSYTDTTAVNGGSYYYVVSALSGTSESGDSASATGTPPCAAPSNLILAPSDALVVLSWGSSAGATSYDIKRSTVSGGPYTTIGSATATTYTDTGVTNGTTYYYVVSAALSPLGEGGTSLEENTVPAVPEQVQKLTGTIIGTAGSYQNNPASTKEAAMDGSLTTAFDAAQGTGAWVGLDLGTPQVITQVRYAPRTNNNGRMTGGLFQGSNTADFSSGVVTLYTVPAAPQYGILTKANVSNATAFRYVRYLGPSNSNCNVAEIEFYKAGPAPAPTNLIATAVSTSQVNLTWTASPGGTSYNIKRATVSGGAYGTVATGLTAKAYNDTGLSGGTTYYYVVSAMNAGGESPDSTESSAATPPYPPGGLTAAAGDKVVALNWNSATGAASYNLKRSLTSGGGYAAVASTASTGYNDTGVVDGTQYYYVVTAVGTGGESVNSGEVSGTPVGPAQLVAPSMIISSGTVNMGVQSVPGRSYQLQRSDTLAANSWVNIGSVQSGTGGLLNFYDPVDPNVPKRFYRIMLGP